MSSTVSSSKLTGRFFRPSTAPSTATPLLQQATRQVWTPGGGVGHRYYSGYCSGEPPHQDLLESDEGALAYDDEGTGVWRLWVREEVRIPGRRRTEEVAARIANERDPDRPLSQIRGRARKELIEDARIELLSEVTPNVRVIPIIATTKWVWIGRRASANDRSIPLFLGPIFGDLELEPLLWALDTPSWTTLSMAALLGFVRSEGGELAPDLHVTEIETKGHPLVLKTSENTEFVRDVVRQTIDASAQIDLKRLGLSVSLHGTTIGVDVDSYGAWRITPRASPGGLPHERLKRRFNDARTAAQRCGEVLRQVEASLDEEK